MATVAELHSRLDDFWAVVKSLKPTSSDEDFAKIGNYIAPESTLYFSGLRNPAAEGPDGAIAEMKGLVQTWGLNERRVLVRAASEDGKTVVTAMNNLITILGQEIEFPETEVVEFDADDLIVNYRLYADPTPILAIFKEKAGAE